MDSVLTSTDPLLFEVDKLSNGITFYQKHMDLPYTRVYIQMPVGSAHNVAGVIPGSHHFMEHICAMRSLLHPGPKDFYNSVAMQGGEVDAFTASHHTTYGVAAANQHLPQVLPGLFAMVAQPFWCEEEIASQRKIVSMERGAKEKWYPGTNETGLYIKTKWQRDSPAPLRQIFGSDEDLELIGPESLSAVHSHYFDPDTNVIVVGNGNIDYLKQELAALSVESRTHAESWDTLEWVRPDFHTEQFASLGNYQLLYGNFSHPRPDLETCTAIGFIIRYLTNFSHGPLYVWLREELGWIYSLAASSNSNPDSYEWNMAIPLTSMDRVDEVRAKVWQQAEAGLRDATAVDLEVDRQIGRSVFLLDSSDKVLNRAHTDLTEHGRIISMTERLQLVENCRDTTWLREVFQEHFLDGMGSMCLAPLD